MLQCLVQVATIGQQKLHNQCNEWKVLLVAASHWSEAELVNNHNALPQTVSSRLLVHTTAFAHDEACCICSSMCSMLCGNG